MRPRILNISIKQLIVFSVTNKTKLYLCCSKLTLVYFFIQLYTCNKKSLCNYFLLHAITLHEVHSTTLDMVPQVVIHTLFLHTLSLYLSLSHSLSRSVQYR